MQLCLRIGFAQNHAQTGKDPNRDMYRDRGLNIIGL